ncbi:MAG: YdcF family protein [Bacteroidia bacterium]|nr:YdcF family protein [Bacteroidia bacterium]MCZ2277799.1 YdcF family protein [Bacteroidia bacterium]
MTKKLLVVLIALIAVPVLIIVNFQLISLITSFYISADFSKIQKPDLIVIPGAGAPDRNLNFYFIGRVEQAVIAHQHFPTARILCIGRDDGGYYHEPQDLKNALMKNGIPDSVILTDSCGFDTFDTVLQLKEKYHGYRMLIISQKIHLERIIFSTLIMGIKAKGLPVTKKYPYRLPQYFRNREIISRTMTTLKLMQYTIRTVFS